MEGLPGGPDSKESTCNVGDLGSIPVSGRSPGEGNGYPLQYSCLQNPMDRGAWGTAVHTATKNQKQLKRLTNARRCGMRIAEDGQSDFKTMNSYVLTIFINVLSLLLLCILTYFFHA